MAKSMRSKTKRKLRARKRATWGRDLQEKALKATQEELKKITGGATSDPALAKFRTVLGGASVSVEGASSSSSSAAAAASNAEDGPRDVHGVLLTTRAAGRRMLEIEAARAAVEAIDAARGSAADGSDLLYSGGTAYDVAHLTGGPVRRGGRKNGRPVDEHGAAPEDDIEEEEEEEEEETGVAAPRRKGPSAGKRALQNKLGETRTRRGRKGKTTTITRVFKWADLPKSGNET